MGKQTMPSQANAQAADYPVADDQRGDILPAERKKRGDRQEMKRRNNSDILPIDRFSGSPEREDILHRIYV
jgi:hypothetical protein